MSRAGGVAPDQDRLLAGRLGQPEQRHPQHVQVIGRGVGPSVAGPQDRGERLAGAIAAVQPDPQRVESEALLAWLLVNRRLTIRYERRADILTAFLQLACALLCARKLRPL